MFDDIRQELKKAREESNKSAQELRSLEGREFQNLKEWKFKEISQLAARARKGFKNLRDFEAEFQAIVDSLADDRILAGDIRAIQRFLVDKGSYKELENFLKRVELKYTSLKRVFDNYMKHMMHVTNDTNEMFHKANSYIKYIEARLRVLEVLLSREEEIMNRINKEIDVIQRKGLLMRHDMIEPLEIAEIESIQPVVVEAARDINTVHKYAILLDKQLSKEKVPGYMARELRRANEMMVVIDSAFAKFERISQKAIEGELNYSADIIQQMRYIDKIRPGFEGAWQELKMMHQRMKNDIEVFKALVRELVEYEERIYKQMHIIITEQEKFNIQMIDALSQIYYRILPKLGMYDKDLNTVGMHIRSMQEKLKENLKSLRNNDVAGRIPY